MKISLLICTIPQRAVMLGRLKSELWSQILPYAGEVEILVDARENEPIGKKRNSLLSFATGDYVAFIDDDDDISVNYIQLLMEAIEKDCDCASLLGVITFNGKDPSYFEHSIKYTEYKTVYDDEIMYQRFPNHLNMIRSSIAKQFKFPEINHGEDTDWATQIYKSGLLKKEYYIDEILYYYRYITKK